MEQMICVKCNREISKDDDYGGAYVWDPFGFYHLICFKEMERETEKAGLAIRPEDGYPE